MAANGSASSGSFVDSTAIRLDPKFSGKSGPLWSASEVRLRFGASPSFAKVIVPLSTALDETAPSVACIAGSLVEGIKGGDYCTINATNGTSKAAIMSGSVTNISRSLSTDTAVIRIEDHRYLLAGLVVKGSFWLSDGNIVYRQGVHPHVNPGKDGANCAIVNGIPVFCPNRMGIASGDDPPSTPTATVAGYWTTALLARYFHYVFANSAAASLAAYADEFKQIPSVIVWKSTYASVLDDAVGAKRAQSFNYEGMKCVAALTKICEESGPFALWMKPLSENKNELQIVKTKYDGDGQAIGRSITGTAGTALNKVVVTGGEYETDFSDLYTMVVASGDFVYIERRLSTYGSLGLKPAWTDDDLTAWKAIIKAPEGSPSAYSKEAFHQASAQYPRVFQAYTIDPTFDFQDGSSQSAFPRAEWPRKVLETLLSEALAEGTANGANLPVKIPVRWEISDDGTNWEEPIANQGWRVDDDGLIWLTGFFNESDDGWNTWSGSIVDEDAVDAIAARYFRATFAIPCDHRITDVVKTSSDPTGGIQSITTGDEAIVSSNLSRLYYADADELYQKVVQNDAWLDTESEGFVHAASNVDPLKDDTEKVKAHTRRRLQDLGRVQRSGRLVYPLIHPAWQPGYMISKMGDFPIQACVREIAFNATANTTELILG